MSRRKRITIYDVAQEVGLSVSTVSRVLNNSTLISDEKAELIRKVATRMGYIKRPIRRQSSRTILNVKLFLPLHEESALHLFYDAPDLIDNIKRGFGETRVNIVAIAREDRTETFDNKRLGQIDGCIFAFARPEPEIRRILLDRHIPFVLLNRRDAVDNYICGDNTKGMALLVDKLAEEARHREEPLRPVYLAFDPVKEISDQRAEGFRLGCGRNGIPIDNGSEYHLQRLHEINDELFAFLKRKKINAVTTFNDILSVFFYQAAMHRGIRIPEDIMLVGFDNSPVSELLDRRIDTVDLETSDLGFKSGEWLRRVIIERTEPFIQEMVCGEYVPGETVSSSPGTYESTDIS